MLEEHSKQRGIHPDSETVIVARLEWMVFPALWSWFWKDFSSPEFTTRLSPTESIRQDLGFWSEVSSRVCKENCSDWQEKKRNTHLNWEKNGRGYHVVAKSWLSQADGIWKSNRVQSRDLYGKWIMSHTISTLNDTRKWSYLNFKWHKKRKTAIEQHQIVTQRENHTTRERFPVESTVEWQISVRGKK